MKQSIAMILVAALVLSLAWVPGELCRLGRRADGDGRL